MTSTSFGDLGIALPPHRHLPEMCHPDDLTTLRRFLRQAEEQPTSPVEPAEIRFGTENNRWTPLTLTGTAVRLSDDEPHHVLCRVTSTAKDSS